MSPLHDTPITSTTDHFFSLPLNHAEPDGEKITVYAREIASNRPHRKPEYLLFLQGGPGEKADRPTEIEGWLQVALQRYRVILLDQRGTGRSTPANRQSLRLRGNSQEQAKYLSYFRADAIVNDAECIRQRIAGPDQPWSVLGQSYGGFCAITYLSYAFENLAEVYITGGLPGLNVDALDVYKAAYPRVERKNVSYYKTYPDDIQRVRDIVEYLDCHNVFMPGGYQLTAPAFQSLGRNLGYPGSFEILHYMLEEAFIVGASGLELSDTFLEQIRANISFVKNPLYAIMHEPIYAQGSATNWAAKRALNDFPQFDYKSALATDSPVLFTGEMIFPWMFELDPALQSLRGTAEILASCETWPHLYKPAQLASNEVPVAATIYPDDIYVDAAHSQQTAENIRGAQVWITDDFDHNGLKHADGQVMRRLTKMLRPDESDNL